MSTCSVVMVSYRTGPVLFHAISRALSQEGLAEVVLVDNGNPPDVLERLRSLAATDARLKVLSGHGNVGFARGCNLGAAESHGDFLMLLNPDCLLPPRALVRMMEALSAHPGGMLAGPLLLNPDGSEQRGGRRALLTPETALSEALALHRFLPVKRLNFHESTRPEAACAVPAISGACMLMKRADYARLEGMDEGYFLHVEDLDLCRRVTDAGGEILYVPQVEVVHLLSTSDAPSRFVERHKAQGFRRYFRKYFQDRPAWLLFALNQCITLRYLLRMLRAAIPGGALSPAAVAGKKMLLLLDASVQPPPHDAVFAGKTIAVTGATSALGMLMIGRLLAQGARVLAVSRGQGAALEISGLSWQQADLNQADFAPMEAAEMLIHCAPLWALPPALPAFSGVARIVAFGSTSVFGKQESANASEQAVVEKLAHAEAVLAAQEGCTVLRPTLIYGAGLDGNVTRIARTISRFRFFPIYPPARGLRQPVHVADLADAALAALATDATRGKFYDLSGGETLTYRAMAGRIFAALGMRAVFLPLPFLPLALDALGKIAHNSRVNGEMARRMNRDLVFPHTTAAHDFGYRPRAFLAGGLKDIEGCA